MFGVGVCFLLIYFFFFFKLFFSLIFFYVALPNTRFQFQLPLRFWKMLSGQNKMHLLSFNALRYNVYVYAEGVLEFETARSVFVNSTQQRLSIQQNRKSNHCWETKRLSIRCGIQQPIKPRVPTSPTARIKSSSCCYRC